MYQVRKKATDSALLGNLTGPHSSSRNQDLMDVQSPHHTRSRRAPLHSGRLANQNRSGASIPFGQTSSTMRVSNAASPRVRAAPQPFSKRTASKKGQQQVGVTESPGTAAHHVYPSTNRQYALKQQNLTFQLTQHIERQQQNTTAMVGLPELGSHTPASRITEEGSKSHEYGGGEAERIKRIVEKKMKASRAQNSRGPGESFLDQLTPFGAREVERKQSQHASLSHDSGSLEQFGPDAVKMRLKYKDGKRKQPRDGSEVKIADGIRGRTLEDKVVHIPEASRHASSASGESGAHSPLGTKAQYLNVQDGRADEPEGTFLICTGQGLKENALAVLPAADPPRTPAGGEASSYEARIIGEVDSAGHSLASYVRKQHEAQLGVPPATPSVDLTASAGNVGRLPRNRYDLKKPKPRDVLQLKNAVFLSGQMDRQSPGSMYKNQAGNTAPNTGVRPSDIGGTPDLASPITPQMQAQVISSTQGLLASSSPRASNMAFSANRNKTVSSKNKNYQPQQVTRRVREQLASSASGTSLADLAKSAKVHFQAVALSSARPQRKRDDAISKVLSQFNIKLAQNSVTFSGAEGADAYVANPHFRRVGQLGATYAAPTRGRVQEPGLGWLRSTNGDHQAYRSHNSSYSPSFAGEGAIDEARSYPSNRAYAKNPKLNQTTADMSRSKIEATPPWPLKPQRSVDPSAIAGAGRGVDPLPDCSEGGDPRLPMLRVEGKKQQVHAPEMAEARAQVVQLEGLMQIENDNEQRTEELCSSVRDKSKNYSQSRRDTSVDGLRKDLSANVHQRGSDSDSKGGDASHSGEPEMMAFKVPVAVEVQPCDGMDQTEDTKEDGRNAANEPSMANELEALAADDNEAMVPLAENPNDMRQPGPGHQPANTKASPASTSGRRGDARAQPTQEQQENDQGHASPEGQVSVANLASAVEEVARLQENAAAEDTRPQAAETQSQHEGRKAGAKTKGPEGPRIAMIDAILTDQSVRHSASSHAPGKPAGRRRGKKPKSKKDSYNIITPRAPGDDAQHLTFDTAANRRQVLKVQSERESLALPAQGGHPSGAAGHQLSNETFELGAGTNSLPDHKFKHLDGQGGQPRAAPFRKGETAPGEQDQPNKEAQVQPQPSTDRQDNVGQGVSGPSSRGRLRGATLSPQRTPLFLQPPVPDAPGQQTNPEMTPSLRIASGAGEERAGLGAGTHPRSPASCSPAVDQLKKPMPTPGPVGQAECASSLLHGVRASLPGPHQNLAARDSALCQQSAAQSHEKPRPWDQYEPSRTMGEGPAAHPGLDGAAAQVDPNALQGIQRNIAQASGLAPENAALLLRAPMAQRQLRQQQAGTTTQAKTKHATDYNVFCAIPQVSILTKDGLPHALVSVGHPGRAQDVNETAEGLSPERQKRAFNLMRALKFSKLSPGNKLKLQHQQMQGLHQQKHKQTGQAGSHLGNRQPTEYSALSRSPMSLCVSPSTDIRQSAAQLLHAPMMKQDISGPILARARELLQGDGALQPSKSAARTIVVSESATCSQKPSHFGAAPQNASKDAGQTHVQAKSNAGPGPEAVVADPARLRSNKSTEHNKSAVASTAQAPQSPASPGEPGAAKVEHDQSSIKLAVLKKRGDLPTLDKSSENEQDTAAGEGEGTNYFERGHSEEAPSKSTKPRITRIEEEAEGAQRTQSSKRTAAAPTEEATASPPAHQTLADLAVLRESFSKDTKHSFLAGNRRERELNREKYLQTLPQNLSHEVEVSKAFGGRNALLHVRRKQERNQSKNKKATRREAGSTLRAPGQAPQMVEAGRRAVKTKQLTSEDGRLEEAANDDSMPDCWSTKEIKEMRMLQNVQEGQSMGLDNAGVTLEKADADKLNNHEQQHGKRDPTSKDLRSLESAEKRAGNAEERGKGKAARGPKPCRKAQRDSKTIVTTRARLEEDHGDMALSLFPPLKQRQISPRYSQLKQGKKHAKGGQKKQRYVVALPQRLGQADLLEQTQESRTLTQQDSAQYEKDGVMPLLPSQFAAFALHPNISIRSHEQDMTYYDGHPANATRSQFEAGSPEVTSQYLREQAGLPCGPGPGAGPVHAGGSAGQHLAASAVASPLKSVAARGADLEARVLENKDGEWPDGIEAFGSSRDRRPPRDGEQPTPIVVERKQPWDEAFLQELMPAEEADCDDAKIILAYDQREEVLQPSKAKYHRAEPVKPKRGQAPGHAAQQLNLRTISIDYDNLLQEEAAIATPSPHDEQQPTEVPHPGAHLASLVQRRRLSRDERLMMTLREYISRKTSPRDGLPEFVGTIQLDPQKPQIIHSTISEDPHTKYVRRIKNNDFLGKKSAKHDETIISQYSQDYERLCILHQGPRLGTDGAAKYAQALQQHRQHLNRERYNNTVLPSAVDAQRQRQAEKLELSLSVLSPLTRREPTFRGRQLALGTREPYQTQKSAHAKNLDYGGGSSRLLQSGKAHGDEYFTAATSSRQAVQEQQDSFDGPMRSKEASKLQAGSWTLGPTSESNDHQYLGRHFSGHRNPSQTVAHALQTRVFNNTAELRQPPAGQLREFVVELAGTVPQRGSQDPQRTQPASGRASLGRPGGQYGQATPATTSVSKFRGVNLPSVHSKDSAQTQARHSIILTQREASVHASMLGSMHPNQPVHSLVPFLHEGNKVKLALRDPLDAVLDKDAAGLQQMRKKLNCVLTPGKGSDLARLPGQRGISLRNAPGILSGREAAGPGSQARVQNIQAKGASVMRSLSPKLNQHSLTILSGEEATQHRDSQSPDKDVPEAKDEEPATASRPQLTEL